MASSHTCPTLLARTLQESFPEQRHWGHWTETRPALRGSLGRMTPWHVYPGDGMDHLPVLCWTAASRQPSSATEPPSLYLSS